MNRKMIFRLFCLLALVGTLILGPTTTAQAGRIITRDEFTIPMDYITYVPCINDGAGDYLHITGVWKYHFHYVIDPLDNSSQIIINGNSQNASAVSETTGMKYQVSQNGQDREKFTGFPIMLNFNSTTVIVGPGKNNIYRAHFSYLYKIDENWQWETIHTRNTVNCETNPYP